MNAQAALRIALRVLLAALGGVAASLLVVGLAYLMRTTVDVALDNYRSQTYIGLNAPKALALAAAALVLLVALPLAVLDGVSGMRFRLRERELRGAHPDAPVAEYAGAEGRGLAFDRPEGRLLLLRPPGGLGAPRLVALPPGEPPAPAPPTDGPAPAA